MANIVTGEMYEEIDGQLHEIKRQIRQKNGYPFNPEELKKALQAIVEGKFGLKLNDIEWVRIRFARSRAYTKEKIALLTAQLKKEPGNKGLERKLDNWKTWRDEWFLMKNISSIEPYPLWAQYD